MTERALVAGDYLILDNARVHAAADTKAYVQALLDYHGVKFRFLPAYSPELNPCELVFAEVKRRLCTEPRLFQSFWQEALRHFACITHRMVNSYYKHCLLAPLGRWFFIISNIRSFLALHSPAMHISLPVITKLNRKPR